MVMNWMNNQLSTKLEIKNKLKKLQIFLQLFFIYFFIYNVMITKFKKFYESTLIDYDIDDIINDYFATALGTEEDQNDELQGKTIYDFSDEAKQQAKEEIEWFIKTAIDLDEDIFEDISDDKIGSNIWYSRNGHGTGFFDDIYDNDKMTLIRLLLDQLCEINLEVGSDDKIYFFGGSNKYKTFNYEEYQRNKAVKKYNL